MFATLVLSIAVFTFLVAIAIFAGGAMSGLANLGMRALRAGGQAQIEKVPAR
jgi:hypothetical protein